MKIKYIITLLIIASCTSLAQEVLTSATWDIGIPVSKMNEYLTDISYRGFTISTRKFLNSENSIGIMAGWNIFDQKNYEPIDLNSESGSGVVSGTQVRSVNSIPILVGFHHYFGQKKDKRVFIGLNTGVYYILQRLDMGVYRLDNDNWHFGLAPEAGLLIPLDRGTSLLFGGRYNYAFDSGTAFGGSENNFYSYWEINIGLSFSSNWF